MARIAAGGGPIQRIPATATCSAKVAFSARNPKPGWTASEPAARAAAVTASTSRRSRPFGPLTDGAMERIPNRSQVRAIRVAISPRLAMKTVWIGVSTPWPADGSVTARVRGPHRAAALTERAEALLGFLGRALARDDPGRVPLRRAVSQATHLADDRLGGPGRRRPGLQ